ncbi:MAG: 50S ribosomal protein L1 [Phycisphaeraceae bacterium]|nr:MAG: 50S ribosomal protein L1 [Phycisphaeraceae bacterium]
MPRLSKRTKANATLVKAEAVAPTDAIAALKKFKPTKFDQTVNICMHLGVDPKQADQALRGSISLPKGIGKTKRVIAFCPSDVAAQAVAAGAVKAGGEELVAEIEKGWMDFDVAIASPDMMRVVSKLGKVLGPKGLMPSPKAGTVTPQVVQAVKEYSAGKVEYRTDNGGNVHAVIGKMSFPDAALVENLEYFVHTIERIRPSSVKGTYIKKVVVSGTMTPSVQIKYAAQVPTA